MTCGPVPANVDACTALFLVSNLYFNFKEFPITFLAILAVISSTVVICIDMLLFLDFFLAV